MPPPSVVPLWPSYAARHHGPPWRQPVPFLLWPHLRRLEHRANIGQLPDSTAGPQRPSITTPSMPFPSGRPHITMDLILPMRTSLSQLSRWVHRVAEPPKHHFSTDPAVGKPEPVGPPPSPSLAKRPSPISAEMGHQPKWLGQPKTGWPVSARLHSATCPFFHPIKNWLI
jgi:hypothetical protein